MEAIWSLIVTIAGWAVVGLAVCIGIVATVCVIGMVFYGARDFLAFLKRKYLK